MRSYFSKPLSIRLLQVIGLSVMLLCSAILPTKVKAGSSNWIGNVGQKDLIDLIKTIKPTKDGGYIGVGNTGYNVNDPARKHDIFVVKFDSDNRVSWSKSYGYSRDLSGADIGNSILEVSDGYIIAGSTDRGACLIKIDFTGNQVWYKVLSPGREYISANEIISTNDGNYAVLAQAPGKTYTNIGVIKIKPSGDILWAHTYEPTLSEQEPLGGFNTGISYWGKKIIETIDGKLIVSGLFARNNTFTRQAMVLSLGSDGKFQWMNRYGDSEAVGSWTDFEAVKEVIELNAMGMPESTGYVLTGFIASNTPGSVIKILLMKIDKFGAPLLQKTYEDSRYNASGNDIEVLGDSFIIGGFAQTLGDIGTTRNALILKVGKDGNFRTSDFQKTYSGIKNTDITSLKLLGNGYLAAGSMNISNEDTDAFILNLDENGVTGANCDSVKDSTFVVKDPSLTPRSITPDVTIVTELNTPFTPPLRKDLSITPEIICAGGGGGTIK